MAHGCQSRTGRSRADTSSLGKRPRSSGAACSECGQSIFSRGLGLITSFTADRFEVCTPNSPVFRFGRLPSPWQPPDWFWGSEDGTFGNRFDDPSGYYRVLYASSQRLFCFIETLARFRPDSVPSSFPKTLPAVHVQSYSEASPERNFPKLWWSARGSGGRSPSTCPMARPSAATGEAGH